MLTVATASKSEEQKNRRVADFERKIRSYL